MDKLKRYIECYIPTETCNLRCHYCYITQQRKFNNKLAEFKYPPNIIRKALSVKRLGGICLLNLCAGGETLLSEQVVEVIRELLEEGHYVMIVTNGTLTEKFEKISKFNSELLVRLIFKFSFHYFELVKKNMLDIYINNVKKMKECGCSFTIEVTPSDELIPYIDTVKKICIENFGSICHSTIARDDRIGGKDILSKYSFDEYKTIWGTFNSDLFNFKSIIYHKKINEFCYAGDWSIYVNIVTGETRQCYGAREIDNIYRKVNSPIEFSAIGNECNQPYCYNGHAFLTLGLVPSMDAITYDQVRNRKTVEGMFWLNEKMKCFMSQKLKDNNIEYTSEQKKNTVIQNFESHTVSIDELSTYIAKQKKIIIVTTGYGGRMMHSFITSLGGKVECFVDNNKELHGKMLFDKAIISLNQLQKRYAGNNDSVIVIGTLSNFVEIKTQLLDIGIKNIIYNEKVLKLLIKYEDFEEKIKILNKNTKKKKVFFCHIPEHGNLGDQAITYATEKFLSDNFSEYEILKFTRDEIYIYFLKIKQIISENDLIFINGGGNMGNLWPEEEQVRKFILHKFKGNKIVSMPTTLTFTNYEEGKNARKESQIIYDECGENLILLAREENSYNDMKKIFTKNIIFKCPDIVFYLSNLFGESNENRKGTRVIFREDKESILNEKREKFINILEDNFYDICMDSTIVNRNISEREREAELFEIWNRFRKSDRIITDRMHGMIFAYITKTPCIVMKSLDNKVSGSYEWIKDSNFVKYVEKFDYDNIESMNKLINTDNKRNCRDFKELYFTSIANEIKRIFNITID